MRRISMRDSICVQPNYETHEQNWIDACKGGPPATSNFDYAGPFTESVVIGNLSVRFPGKKLEWDGENMRVTNHPPANDYSELALLGP
jgi:hypothetical protein